MSKKEHWEFESTLEQANYEAKDIFDLYGISEENQDRILKEGFYLNLQGVEDPLYYKRLSYFDFARLLKISMELKEQLNVDNIIHNNYYDSKEAEELDHIYMWWHMLEEMSADAMNEKQIAEKAQIASYPEKWSIDVFNAWGISEEDQKEIFENGVLLNLSSDHKKYTGYRFARFLHDLPDMGILISSVDMNKIIRGLMPQEEIYRLENLMLSWETLENPRKYYLSGLDKMDEVYMEKIRKFKEEEVIRRTRKR
jgi:hypothetical protein